MKPALTYGAVLYAICAAITGLAWVTFGDTEAASVKPMLIGIGFLFSSIAVIAYLPITRT